MSMELAPSVFDGEDYNANRTFESFGVDYVFRTNIRLPTAVSSNSDRNSFVFYKGLCQKRLVVTDADERVATMRSGEADSSTMAFFVHPKAREQLDDFKNAVYSYLGGAPSEISELVFPPKDRQLTAAEVIQAIDDVLFDEQFAVINQLVEDLRPVS